MYTIHYPFLCLPRVSPPPPLSNYPHFIVYYSLHRTKRHSSVTFTTLVLLWQLKVHFWTAWESSGHCLFVSAHIKGHLWHHLLRQAWSIVAQGMFQLWEINQMERKICQYLKWETIHWSCHAQEVQEHDLQGLHQTQTLPYIYPLTKKSTLPPTANPFTAPLNTVLSPSHGQRYPSHPNRYSPPPQNPPSCGRPIEWQVKYVCSISSGS